MITTHRVKLASDEAKALGGAIVREMNESALIIAGDAKRALQANGTNATGKLAQSLQDGVDPIDGGFAMWLGMQRYGRWVELGRQPGKQPPLQPITRWVHRKPVPVDVADERVTAALVRAIQTKIGKGRASGKKPPLAVIQEWIDEKGITPSKSFAEVTAARAIARKIGREGTKAQPFIEPALVKEIPGLVDRLTAIIGGRA